MGATAALLYLSKKGTEDYAIAGVFDSPYADLEEIFHI
jgi:hypothetical protein